MSTTSRTYFEIAGIGDGYSLDRDTGLVECLEDGRVWCEHVQEATTTNKDAVFVWGEENEELRPTQKVYVPIVPTANLWAVCDLELNEKVHAYSVTFMSQFIGFIHRGEGRGVLRSMLVDWFLGFAGHDKTKSCPNPNHTFAAQKMWERDFKLGGGRVFAQRWSVMTTDKCLGCAGVSDGFDPDLIPDEDKKASPWNG